MYGTVRAALDRLTMSLCRRGSYAGRGSPSNARGTVQSRCAPVSQRKKGAGVVGSGQRRLYEDISPDHGTVLILCTGDPSKLTGQIACTQPFLQELGRLRLEITGSVRILDAAGRQRS